MSVITDASPARTHDLAQQVVDLIGVPKDEWEIAAQLEVMGLRDSDARAEHGARDLFDLARRIYSWVLDGRLRTEIEPEDPIQPWPGPGPVDPDLGTKGCIYRLLREIRAAADEDDERRARALVISSRSHHGLSFTDAVSLVVMEKFAVADAFAVDANFLSEEDRR